MANDIVGPTNAPNTTTTRPTDTRTGFGLIDTWFKDCTSALLNDGTRVMAAWLNATIGQFRSAIRGNGITALGAAVVAEDNSDGMLLAAIKHLIQRGQPIYAEDTGTVGAVVIAPSPAAAEYKKGMTFRIKAAATSGPGGTTINVSGLGLKTVVRRDSTPVLENDIVAGAVQTYIYDGTNFQIDKMPGGFVYLLGPKVIYVNGATGLDTYDGTTATVGGGHGPFRTLQKALAVTTLYNLNGYNVTVYVADSTYANTAPIFLPRINGSGSVYIIGNTVTPANVVFSCSAGSTFRGAVGGGYIFDGMTVLSTASASGDPGACFYVSGGVQLNKIVFGVAPYAHMISVGGGVLSMEGPFTIAGAAQAHIIADAGGNVQYDQLNLPTLTISGTPNFSQAFMVASRLSTIAARFSSITGSATGARYSASGNSVVDTGGGGASYLPGNASGSLGTGGQYL